MRPGHTTPDEILGYTLRCCDYPHLFSDDAAFRVFYETHDDMVGRKT